LFYLPEFSGLVSRRLGELVTVLFWCWKLALSVCHAAI